MPAPAAAPKKEPALRRLLFHAGYDRTSGPTLLRPLRALSWVLFTTLLVAQSEAVRGRRLRAAATFWRCQVLRRRGHALDVDLGAGHGRLVVPRWSAIGTVVAATGAHEPRDETFAVAAVAPGEGFVDVGANIGLYSILVGLAGATVTALEPVTATRATLEGNVDANGLGGRVRVLPYAVGDFDGEAQLTTGLDAQNRLVLDASAGAGLETAAVRTLDSVVAEHEAWFEAAPPTLVKIDVEGFEMEALRGAAGLIARWRPVLMVETFGGGETVRAHLEGLGYRVYWYRADGVLVPFPDRWPGNFGFHTNMIAVTDDRLGALEQRLASAPSIRRPAPTVRALPAES